MIPCDWVHSSQWRIPRGHCGGRVSVVLVSERWGEVRRRYFTPVASHVSEMNTTTTSHFNERLDTSCRIVRIMAVKNLFTGRILVGFTLLDSF